jgi:hypothetical protein
VDRAFSRPTPQTIEQTTLLLIGAANDALQELNVQQVRAVSYKQQQLFFQASSPATRVMALIRIPEITESIKNIYHRRGGRLSWKKIIIRVGITQR